MEKQHAYRKIEHDLKNEELKNVVLLFGKEQYLVKWAVDSIVKKYVNDECKAFDFFEISSEQAMLSNIVESCETLSMFSEKRVVLLSDFALISGDKLKNIPDDDEKRLIEYLKEIPGTCILIITSESADKRKKLYKEIASCGNAYEFETLDERSLKGFVEKRFTALGKRIRTSVVDEFINHSGYFHKEADYTLYNLVNEIKKISAHASGDEILLSDVLAVVSGDIETNIFAMIDAASRNKKDEAFQMLYNILGSGGNIFQVLALMASQFEIMLEVKEMREEGKNLAQMQSVLNIHEFRIKKAMSVCNAYSVSQLKDILQRIYQVERNIKTGLMEQTLAFEVMLSQI
jgi:DNA polymerase-3 subunit delta